MNDKVVRIEIYEKHTHANRICTEFEFGPPLLKAFAPLNPNREIVFDTSAQADAREAEALRNKVAAIVADRFIRLLRMQDPQNGYLPTQ